MDSVEEGVGGSIRVGLCFEVKVYIMSAKTRTETVVEAVAEIGESDDEEALYWPAPNASYRVDKHEMYVARLVVKEARSVSFTLSSTGAIGGEAFEFVVEGSDLHSRVGSQNLFMIDKCTITESHGTTDAWYGIDLLTRGGGTEKALSASHCHVMEMGDGTKRGFDGCIGMFGLQDRTQNNELLAEEVVDTAEAATYAGLKSEPEETGAAAYWMAGETQHGGQKSKFVSVPLSFSPGYQELAPNPVAWMAEKNIERVNKGDKGTRIYRSPDRRSMLIERGLFEAYTQELATHIERVKRTVPAEKQLVVRCTRTGHVAPTIVGDAVGKGVIRLVIVMRPYVIEWEQDNEWTFPKRDEGEGTMRWVLSSN